MYTLGWSKFYILIDNSIFLHYLFNFFSFVILLLLPGLSYHFCTEKNSGCLQARSLKNANFQQTCFTYSGIGSLRMVSFLFQKCLRVIPLKTIFNLTSSHICQWENCTKKFTNYQWYLYHIHQHMEDNPRGNKVEGGVRCRWTACMKKFPSIYKLREHMRCHTKEKTCACPDCGITFASNTKFHDHCRRQIPIDGKTKGLDNYNLSHS